MQRGIANSFEIQMHLERLQVEATQFLQCTKLNINIQPNNWHKHILK